MRITSVLRAQHLGHMFKKHWKIQGKRTPHETPAFAILEKKGIPIIEATELVNKKEPKLPEPVDTRFQDPEPELNEKHPLYNKRICHIYGDSNVLIEGVAQAQVLTKTLTVRNLPAKLQKFVDDTEISTESDLYMKNAILSAHLLDAEQVKLPKRKDPLKPAWNFPRDYGISAQRKNQLITAKILLECEKLSGLSVASGRKVINDARFIVSLEKDDNLYRFESKAETVISSKVPLSFEANEPIELENRELPNLYPMECNLSIPTSHFYKLENVYPFFRKSPYSHLHTIFVHYTTEDVKNLHATPVTPAQFESRNMLKAFTAAASRARALYGPDVEDLPSPINVQSVQVNGNEFYFGVYQLNTLDLAGIDGEKNLWFNISPLKLYDECTYLVSRPRLNGYNPEVLKLALAFYQNQ